MLNQLILVGRIYKEIEITEDENKKAVVTIAVPRSYKNENGEYDTDFISCILWDGIAESTAEYCKKGDIIGIKGRIQSDEEKNIQIIAEKITFLSSRKEEKE